MSLAGPGSLKAYTLRRIFISIPLIFAIIIFNFVLFRITPGDPVRLILERGESSPELEALLTRELGLDKPIYEQLYIYTVGVMRGDLGTSFREGRPVLQIILEKVPATLTLFVAMIVLVVVGGIAAGVVAAIRKGTTIDHAITAFAASGYSIPAFFSGMILLLTFSLILGWFPTGGMVSARTSPQGVYYLLDVLHHLALPAVAFAMNRVATTTRITRASMLEILRQDYIMTANSKGLAKSKVIRSHALRNALLPIATIISIEVQHALAGAVIIEILFSWPGIGRLTVGALYSRDYPVVQGVILIVSLGVILVNLVTDIVYSFLDPRIRYR